MNPHPDAVPRARSLPVARFSDRMETVIQSLQVRSSFNFRSIQVKPYTFFSLSLCISLSPFYCALFAYFRNRSSNSSQLLRAMLSAHPQTKRISLVKQRSIFSRGSNLLPSWPSVYVAALHNLAAAAAAGKQKSNLSNISVPKTLIRAEDLDYPGTTLTPDAMSKVLGTAITVLDKHTKYALCSFLLYLFFLLTILRVYTETSNSTNASTKGQVNESAITAAREAGGTQALQVMTSALLSFASSSSLAYLYTTYTSLPCCVWVLITINPHR